MNNDFKEWLCKKAGRGKLIPLDWKYCELEILIKAMWAINRKGKYYIILEPNLISVNKNEFFYAQYNNSEQKALEKALEYIYEQEKI
jgi:hypothetical protein